jgi:NTP pyrophosphatase (non-canonical NTP hydrolase)
MSNWKEIWDDQTEFNRNFRDPRPKEAGERIAQTKEMVLGLFSETDELLRAIDWKEHRRPSMRYNPRQVHAEIADIFKYFVSLCLIWDVSPEDLTEIYWWKSAVVLQRYSEEFVKTLEGKIALVDIDGVLCDYYNGFLNWLLHSGHMMSHQVEKIRAQNRYISAQALGLSKGQFRELKHEFRACGAKASMPVCKGADVFLAELRHQGYTICLVTSRPIEQYPNMRADTQFWLEENQLFHDFVWWSHHKIDIVEARHALERVELAVEDDPAYALPYAESGIFTFLVRTPYFKDCARHHNLRTVNNLEEITEHVIRRQRA